jgi:uncharacterized protein YbjT (DUF2867 family)
MILVTGATGNAGSEVVRALRERGAPVRAFVRDPAAAGERFGEDVDLAIGDFADAASVRAALDGAERVFLSGADTPDRVGYECRLIDAAAAAGVRQLVKLSGIGSAPDSPVAPWAWHGQVEQHLTRSGVPAVLLRANFYMSNLLASTRQIAGGGMLAAPAGSARIGMVDPRDVGACAAAVLTEQGHDGRMYVLTGPRAITFADVAGEISRIGGSAVAYVDLPDEVALGGLVATGLPEPVASAVVSVFGALRAGAGEQVTDTVRALTGCPPADVADFLHRHAHLFAAIAVGTGR